MKVEVDQIMGERGRQGTLLKYSSFIFDLGHMESLKVLNKDYVLHVKKGFVPHTLTKGGETGLEAVVWFI